jgi:hypothetical protein
LKYESKIEYWQKITILKENDLKIQKKALLDKMMKLVIIIAKVKNPTGYKQEMVKIIDNQ